MFTIINEHCIIVTGTSVSRLFLGWSFDSQLPLWCWWMDVGALHWHIPGKQ